MMQQSHQILMLSWYLSVAGYTVLYCIYTFI